MPHSRSLRTGRVSTEGQVYLCSTVTQHRQELFKDWRIGRLVIAPLRWLDQNEYTTTFAYVVMPDHCHWLFALGDGKRLSDVMAAMKKQSARLVNQALGTNGPIWQSGFHDHALRNDELTQRVAWYVINNPIRSGLVEDIGRYPLWDARWLCENPEV